MGVRTFEFAVPAHEGCGGCARRLHEQVAVLAGVRSVTADFARGVVRVEADEEGYVEADLSTRVEQSLADAHPSSPLASTTSRKHDAHELAELNGRRLLIAFGVGAAIMAVEVVGALASNSLVLLADAAHYATDLAAILLAFLAVRWSVKAATSRKTFGYERAEVVAAFTNAIALWGISAYLIYESVQRMRAPPTVDGRVVAAIGAVSLGANLALAALLKRGTGDNLNVRAAYLHIVSDALGSAAALAAGAAVYFWGLHVADPILTLLITVLILVFTWNLTRQTLHILLEGAPAHAHPDEISAALRGVPGVRDVHDLHVWTLASGVDSVSAHVVLHGTPKDDSVSHVIHRELRGRYGIDHVTVQLEDPDCLCETTRHAWAGGQGSSAAPP